MQEIEPQGEIANHFLLKDQLKETQINMLYFLFNSEFQNLIEKIDQRTPFHLQSKKYKRSVSINPLQVKQLFHTLSQKLHQKVINEDHECFKALNKLQTLWQVQKVQYFHRYYFQKYVYSTYLSSILTLIKHEDNLIRSELHIYYSIEKTIWARQACLNHLRRQLRVLGQQDIYEHLQTVKDRQIDKNRKIQKRMYKVYGYRAKYTLDQKQTKLGTTRMETLSEVINGYRKLTYHLVELIARWKMYMQSLTHDPRIRKQKIEFYYKDYNLYLTLLNDASFISTSFLSNFYTLTRNDPFLLKPILAIDKKLEEGEEANFETVQLKRIINCKLQDIPKINSAISYLYNEVYWNHTHQKYYQKKGLLQYRSVNLEKSRSEIKLTPQISVKSKLSIQNSQKLSPVKIVKQKSSQLAKSNVILRKKSENIRITNTNNIFKTSKGNNPQSNPLYLLESSQLKTLKQQIYRKVKDELDFQSKKVVLQSKRFADKIEQQVRQSFQKYLDDTAKQMLQDKYEITPLSFYDEQISSYITRIYKQIPVQFGDIQIPQNDLLKTVLQNSYCYILKVHTSKNEVANIIANVNRTIAEHKSIEVQLVSFKFPQTLQKIVLKTVQFFWKYDNGKELILKLHYHNQQTKQFVKELQSKLEGNCTIIQKKYKNHIQSKFIFTNKIFNKRYVYNPHAQKVHFKLYSALCLEKIQLQSPQVSNLSAYLHYDYLIMEILRKYTNSQDFITLRDTFRTKDRLRYLLNQLMEIQNNKDFQVNITTIDAQNFTQLNHKLKYLKKPLLEVNDLVLINNIKMIQLQYTLTIAYQMKALSSWNNEHSHRYVVKEEISYFCDDLGCQFYLLPVQETHHLKIIVFSALNYLSKYKKGLNMYLFQTLQRSSSKWKKKYVENIWIEMLRYPPNYAQRQAFLLTSYRTHEFDSIHKQVIIGESFDWFTDIQIQNGLQYKKHKDDIDLTKPLGVGIITNKNWILYSRVFGKDQKSISENV